MQTKLNYTTCKKFFCFLQENMDNQSIPKEEHTRNQDVEDAAENTSKKCVRSFSENPQDFARSSKQLNSCRERWTTFFSPRR